MKKFLILFSCIIISIAIIYRLCNGNESDGNDSQGTISGIANIPDPNGVADGSYLNFTDSSLELPKLMSDKPEQILRRAGYITSYNNSTKNANWVAWHLTRDHTDGDETRNGLTYIVDEEVNGPRQELDDWRYHNLPIDHGHLCPAGDCEWSWDAMEQSFLLTNIVPQNSDLNRGAWEYLESRCRGWAKHFGEVFIATGPIYYSDNYQTIGDNKVAVPDAFFKVVLRMGKKPEAIGFIYANDDSFQLIDQCATTVDKVEEIAGIDFFYNLPDDIEGAVESVYDLKKWFIN